MQIPANLQQLIQQYNTIAKGIAQLSAESEEFPLFSISPGPAASIKIHGPKTVPGVLNTVPPFLTEILVKSLNNNKLKILEGALEEAKKELKSKAHQYQKEAQQWVTTIDEVVEKIDSTPKLMGA